MYQTFPAMTVGDANITMNELQIGQALSLAKMDASKMEQQLTSFLRYALKDDSLPYTMTVQQRYYCLLQYLGAQKENDLAVDVNVNDYLISEDREWKTVVQLGEFTIRQLTGLEIEALEMIAEGLDDWLVGAMALQMSFGTELPYIQPLTDRRHASKVIKTRHETLMQFGQERINELYKVYSQAEEQLSSLLYIGYDNDGVVIFDTKGGSTSEAARFQCNSAFYGFTQQLFSALAERSTAATERLEHELE